MSFAELFAWMKRYDERAAVIFDQHEPIGRPTDLVLPPPRWSLFRRRTSRKISITPSEAPQGTRP